MNFALGELEALAKKAAKGLGYSWGEAEEAGQAMRILAASKLPAVRLFTQYFSAVDANQIEVATCPVRLGCRLVDGADLGVFNCTLPTLLMPFVARRAVHEGSALTLSSASFRATAGPDLAIIVERSCFTGTGLTLEPALTAPELSRVYRADAELGNIAVLDGFAHRTYAPETEGRRAAGAGAGDDGNA